MPIFLEYKNLRALDALESGDYSPSLYDTIGDAWDIEERTFAALAEYGFSPALATDAADPHAIRDLLMRPPRHLLRRSDGHCRPRRASALEPRVYSAG